MDDDLVCPAIILVPVFHSFRIVTHIQPAHCTHNIVSNVTVSEHMFHLVLLLMPVLICQVVAIGNFANV